MSKDIHLIQEDFLYGLTWDAKIDSIFVDVLADQALMGTFEANSVDKSDAIGTAQYIVNRLSESMFDYKCCARQVRKLKKRHQVFSWLIRLEGVHYDQATNRVLADPNLWPAIKQVNQFAQAYEMYGDPAWKSLKVLFGNPPVGPSQLVEYGVNNDVIAISSDDEMIRAPLHNKGKNKIIKIDSSGDTSEFNRFWNEIGASRDDSDSENSPSFTTIGSTTNTTRGLSTPSKGPPPSWVGVSPWKK